MRASSVAVVLCVATLAFCFDLERALRQVGDHQKDADDIVALVTTGAQKHVAFNRLANFTDTIGHRVSGSDALTKAEDWMLAALQADGLTNVHGETVSIPKWVRGNEYATMLSPRTYDMSILGLGTSIGTGSSGITAEVLVVQSFDQLANVSSQAKGKIVVYNQQCDWVAKPINCYGESVGYRSSGAVQAAKYGAVAALVRSVAPFSINSPHTGSMQQASIPGACITIEDAEMLQRIQDRGQKITIKLYMEAQNYAPVPGRNIVAEIKGSVYPEQTVIVSGHLDSWDVGQGAMDDGGGAIISWSVLSIVKVLGLKPKRTIRLVMWSCEEFGGVGAGQYYNAHASELPNMDLVMESDLGVFHPKGIEFTGTDAARTVMTAVGALLKKYNLDLVTTGGEGTDIAPWMNHGVPGASLSNENEKYFFFHHSNGDTMAVLDADDVDLCAAVWAVTAYVVADLDDLLPR